MVGEVDLLHLSLGIVLDDDLERAQHGHDPFGPAVEVLAQAVLEQGHVHHVVGLGDADALAEVADGLGGVAPAADAAEGRQARIVPAGDDPFGHELDELALAEDGVGKVEAGELDLSRMARDGQVVEHPVVKRPVVLELQRADGVRHPFQGVRDAMGVVVHRVDAPGVARAVVGDVLDAVEDRVAQHHIGALHVDLGPQHLGPVRKFAGAHATEEIEVLGRRAVAEGAVLAGFGEGAAVGPDFLLGEVVDVGQALPDERLGEGVEPVEIVRGVKAAVLPVEAEPAHVLLDGVDVFHLFLGRVGVVEAQVALAAVIPGQAEIEADGLGVADVQVAVGLGREAGVDAAAPFAGADVLVDDLADEIPGRGRSGRGLVLRVVCGHGWSSVGWVAAWPRGNGQNRPKALDGQMGPAGWRPGRPRRRRASRWRRGARRCCGC